MNYWQRLINVLVWVIVTVGLFFALWALLHWPGWISGVLAVMAAFIVVEYLEGTEKHD